MSLNKIISSEEVKVAKVVLFQKPSNFLKKVISMLLIGIHIVVVKRNAVNKESNLSQIKKKNDF